MLWSISSPVRSRKRGCRKRVKLERQSIVMSASEVIRRRNKSHAATPIEESEAKQKRRQFRNNPRGQRDRDVWIIYARLKPLQNRLQPRRLVIRRGLSSRTWTKGRQRIDRRTNRVDWSLRGHGDALRSTRARRFAEKFLVYPGICNTDCETSCSHFDRWEAVYCDV